MSSVKSEKAVIHGNFHGLDEFHRFSRLCHIAKCGKQSGRSNDCSTYRSPQGSGMFMHAADQHLRLPIRPLFLRTSVHSGFPEFVQV